MPALARIIRATLPLAVLVGLVPGCAHRGGGSAGEEAAEPASPDRSTVTAEDIRRQPGEPVEEILAGRVAGVRVFRTPDGGIAVRIRGTSSIRGDAEPLYVIDGVPIQPGPNGELTGISPYEIESIEVLKDAATTTMYGSRGANGVILIKLKRPGR
ncbi:MAG: TonB-dependent receptor plug domain-containing protein [Gemmatimonadota bacterium]